MLFFLLASCRDADEPVAPSPPVLSDPGAQLLQEFDDPADHPEGAATAAGSCVGGVECIEVIYHQSAPDTESFTITMEGAGNLATIDGEVPETGVTFVDWISRFVR